MESRKLNCTQHLVSAIGQGTWFSETDDRDSAIAALRLGLDLGMTHIDTAEMYLSGGAEEWVATAIEGRRDEVFLVSKVLPEHRGVGPSPPVRVRSAVSRPTTSTPICSTGAARSRLKKPSPVSTSCNAKGRS